MSEKLHLTNDRVQTLAIAQASAIRAVCGDSPRVYPIPRGGVPVAYLLTMHLPNLIIVDEPDQANVFVDDLVDSGGTKNKWLDRFPGRYFAVLLERSDPEFADKWIVFPWESSEQSEDDSIVGTIVNRFRSDGIQFKANDNIAAHLLKGEVQLIEAEVERRASHLLDALIIDRESDHNTKETAKRMAKMYCREIFTGRYTELPKITEFPNAAKLDEMYITGPITIRSTCSHHFCPIMGQAWVGVIPGENVVGLSKINRMVDWIASRPQIQEEMVVQIADLLEKRLVPAGVAVVIRATHTCMTWRGVRESTEAVMQTNVMRGAFREKPEARAEFMASIKE